MNQTLFLKRGCLYSTSFTLTLRGMHRDGCTLLTRFSVTVHVSKRKPPHKGCAFLSQVRFAKNNQRSAATLAPFHTCSCRYTILRPLCYLPFFPRQLSTFSHRYTVLRNGRQRLLVPNSHFVNREFLVTDAGPMVARPAKIRTDPPRGVKSGRTGGTNGPPPQPGMPSQKVAPNGREKRGGFFPTLSSRLGPGQMPSGPGVPSPHGK